MNKYINYYWIGQSKTILLNTLSDSLEIDLIENKKYHLDISEIFYCYYLDKSFFNNEHPYRCLNHFNINSTKNIFAISLKEANKYYKDCNVGALSFSKKLYKSFKTTKYVNINDNYLDIFLNSYTIRYIHNNKTYYTSIDKNDININYFLTEDMWRNRQLNKLIN